MTCSTAAATHDTQNRGRNAAVATLALGALVLAGAAAYEAFPPATQAPLKTTSRLDAGPVEKRELVYYPRELVADESLRVFKPGPGWTTPASAPASGEIPVAQAHAPAAPRARLAAAAPLPPARPAALKPAADAREVAAERPPRGVIGVELAHFVPTGSDIARRIGGLGATMRDSIGSVGSSLGKMMRISSR